METSYNYMLGRMLAVFLLLLAFSCGSDDPDPDPVPEPTRAELIAQQWIIGSVTIGGQVENISGYSISFQPNGNFNFSTPGVSGLPTSGTWALNSAESSIMLNGSVELIIRNLTKTGFAFDYTYQNHKEGNVLVQFVLRK